MVVEEQEGDGAGGSEAGDRALACIARTMDHSRATRAEAGLLASIRAPRQSHALDGKLKTVVVPSIDEYEHLGRAVQVRDSLPQAEVRSLPQEVRPIVGAPLQGIRAMREDRRRRHEATMADLEARDGALADRLVEAVQGAVQEFLTSMRANDEDIDGRLEQLRNSRIEEVDEEGIQNVFNFMLDQRAVRASMFDRMTSFLASCDKDRSVSIRARRTRTLAHAATPARRRRGCRTGNTRRTLAAR